jgi:aminopeptidase N
MRIYLLWLSAFFVFNTQAQNRPIDILHYEFNLELSDGNDSIRGTTNICFAQTQPGTTLTLDLAQTMKVISINNSRKVPLNSSHFENKLVIQTGKSNNTIDTACISIQYVGVPKDGLIISKNKYGKKTFFADNWPNRARHWLPCVDDPADKASVDFIVIAPAHYQVISNGIQIEETNLPGNKRLTHYKEDVPLPTKVMVIGVAEFAVGHAGMAKDCIPVSSWVFPEDRNAGFADFEMGKNILEWYIDYIGPYPYKKLANVQSKTIFGGMENAGAIFYYEDVASGKRKEETLIAHEIVHQWFGDHATEKSFAHLWLSEGFATYLTHVFIEAKYGTDSLNKRMKSERSAVLEFTRSSKKPVVDTTNNLMSLLNTNSYQKGSWVLHMLRRQLGDSIFRRSIRDYYNTYAGKNADSDDLRKIFEKNSGKDLDQFFRQWLHVAEHPNLAISWRYKVPQKSFEVRIEQQQPTTFRFPLELELVSGSGSTSIQRIDINTRLTVMEFPVSFLVTSVFPDPNTSLLFSATVTEMK